MKLKWSALIVPALLLAWTAASADDGEITNKRMTGGNTDNQLTVLPEDVLEDVSHAEHAFTDMMKFYVPSQAASGLPGPVEYYNVDGNLVETLGVAKPLVNVFLYGPAIEVPETAFAHSFMDVYGAVSLDDGTTWKTTNLSQSADESSFTLGVDGGGGSGDDHDVPADHTVIERNEGIVALHMPGLDYPYSYECTDCHGATLEGGHHSEPSCYSCHGSEWEEDAPDGVMVIYIEEAYAKLESSVKIKLEVEGEVEGVDEKTIANLINGVTEEFVASEKVEDDGEFEFELKQSGIPPCTVAVVVDDVKSATVPLIDKRTGEPVENCEGEVHDLTVYPGGAYNVFHATVGNKVLAAWPSRYCRQGQPTYAMAWDGDDSDQETALIERRQNLEGFLQIDRPGFSIENDLYLTDLFGVAGSQGSIDFAEEGYPQAGEVPHGCVWTARGVLVPGDDPRTTEAEASYMVWTKPERLTSGRRDPNRIEVRGVAGAGFVITWQEDPDGLRPGQGLGPGEGWSGAVAHDKTDVWYSFIPWEYFDLVENPADANVDYVSIESHDLLDTGRPQVYVPMAVPMRLTNNAKCSADFYFGTIPDTDPRYFSYCNFDVAEAYGLQDFCAATAQVATGQDGTLTDICVNEDGLPNVANTASTRPRLSLQGYDSDGNGLVDRAWVIVAAEESKGLGSLTLDPYGNLCTDPDADGCEADIGKNQWYFSFDMGDPDTSATVGEPNGLVQNLVNQGNLLNQPEVDWKTGEFYPMIDASAAWGLAENTISLYNTEIARRSSLLVQSIAKASNSTSGILATPSWKQGAMRQGGPADTMLRRFVLPDPANYVEDGITTNPYAFTNMECNYWLPEAVGNPYYPDGVCGEPATNLSSVVPDTCIDDDTGASTPCPTVNFTGSTFGIGDTNPILRGLVQGEGNTTRVLTWHQCPSDIAQTVGDITPVTCDTDLRTDVYKNLKDQSWYNPLDISKGHRGFIDGDFVMFLYAWSPNWRLNAKGSDRYDLYVRRSFDGGLTWRTTPESFTASDGNTYSGDGTVTCESYRPALTQASGEREEPKVCYTFGAGADEHARNVTQHRSMNITTLDPRYAPTAASITAACLDGLGLESTGLWGCDDGYMNLEGDSDLRDPSRYFMVFETGDNDTVAVGEAEPLDLFYSRAENFGDDYVVWTETDTTSANPEDCYPHNAYGVTNVAATILEGSGFCNEFDRMNTRGDTHSSEANLESNPDGSKLYGVWAQWVFDDYGDDVVESDAMARRIWYIDRWVSDINAYTLPGTNQP